ncbi:MAG: HutD family protein [Polyangiaceae bacterium]
MRHLTPDHYVRMPWRNGGGTTTELVVEHGGRGAMATAGARAERFLYRVSIADVETDGPFSRFEGYDRHIMMLSGRGMTIDCGAHGVLDLAAPFEPRTFSGDWDVTGTLRDGAVRDFNLIVDRARATSSLAVRPLTAPIAMTFDAGQIGIIYVIAGALVNAASGDTIVADAPIELTPRGEARIAVATVHLNGR